MPVFALTKPSLYKDSLTLMRVAQRLGLQEGVRRAMLVMGTEANKRLLAASGLLATALERAAADDLMIALEADAPWSSDRLAEIADRWLNESTEPEGMGARRQPARSLLAARARLPGANLAVISVPGLYAAAEAMKALKAGLNVFLFSDNVPVADERRLKEMAQRKGLLLMGPDCGTALIDGVPLGFANAVRRGSVGVVGAAGTGIQELICGIHERGGGISQAIGTGGRDLTSAIGGIATMAAIERLAADDETETMIVLGKPAAPEVASQIAELLRRVGKPSLVLFIGAERRETKGTIRWVADLEEAAAAATDATPTLADDDFAQTAAQERARYASGQSFIRGLYTGGTYALEAQAVWRRSGLVAFSNALLEGRQALGDPQLSREHTALDLGEDAFTVGRPHPMIDPSVRIERLRREAADPTVATIVLDIVIGAGAHEDPAGAVAPAVIQAKAAAEAAGRHLTVIAWVCGTEADRQRRSRQEATLRAAGVLVLRGSTAAARLAASCVVGD